MDGIRSEFRIRTIRLIFKIQSTHKMTEIEINNRSML